MQQDFKRVIQRELSKTGWLQKLKPKALDFLVAYFQKHDGTLQDLSKILKAAKAAEGNPAQISEDGIKCALDNLSDGGTGVTALEVVDAFHMPRISYDAVQKKLYQDQSPRSLFAKAEAKQAVYQHRLQMLQQRIRRNKLFQKPTACLGANSAGVGYAQLTDVGALAGMVGESAIVMGTISQLQDGRYFLEDPSGVVPMSLTDAQTTEGFFTENCIVMAEGTMGVEGVFHVSALGFPPAEARLEAPDSMQKLNFFGGQQLTPKERLELEQAAQEHPEERIVVLADVWLDKQTTLDRLHTLLLGFSQLDSLPPVFVFMGNFLSTASEGAPTDVAALRTGFASLARLLDQYQRIKEVCQFVFIPGPGDPSPAPMIPQPPLPSLVTQELRESLPTAIFASNPCRLRYLGREMVLFRYNLLAKMRRKTLVPLQDATDPQKLFAALAGTVLQQSHLCPLPLVVQPVWWQFDHALQLYPLPHSLVLADRSPQAHHTHKGCTVFNPGCFSEGLFAAHLICSQDVDNAVEMSEIPGEMQQGDEGYGEEGEGDSMSE